MKHLTLAAGAAFLALSGTANAAPPAPPATFARCAMCHNAAKDAPAKIGPNLWGVFGAKAASSKGFTFSPELKAAKLKWNAETLDKWIAGPMTMVPGTMMGFPGLKDPAKRAEIIAYLQQLH